MHMGTQENESAKPVRRAAISSWYLRHRLPRAITAKEPFPSVIAKDTDHLYRPVRLTHPRAVRALARPVACTASPIVLAPAGPTRLCRANAGAAQG